MARKKSKEPRRHFTKHQLTRAQQRKRKQRIFLITGISVVSVVAGVIGSGWYAEQGQPTGADQETLAQLSQGSGDFDEGTRILGGTQAPDEEAEVRILGNAKDPNEEAEPQIIGETQKPAEETEPQIIGETENPSPETGPQVIVPVSAQEAFALIQENQNNPDFVIIDVRKPEEFAEGHIAEAINRSKHSSSFEAELDKLDKTKTYLVYCRKCVPPYPCNADPPGAAAVMKELGFEKVYNMGGIIQWEAEGYPLVQ